LLVLASGLVYHHVFVKAISEGWPILRDVAQLVTRGEAAQRDRLLRENLDAMAERLGELQAKLVKLEAVSDRVAGQAGVQPAELQPLRRPASAAGARGGSGGPLIALPEAISRWSAADLDRALTGLDHAADQQADILTLVESRLFESRLAALLVPSVSPVDGPVGSGFGVRSDPITGRAALHAGLDFPADIGTPIVAAAGGVVTAVEWHPAYGHVLQIDHGRDLATLYAHNSRILVKQGDIVRRGQHVADVGNSGRSTGPHLHFEVLVQGVPQNPARFLAAGRAQAPLAAGPAAAGARPGR
jgi:murein DD-endopeptidase MepM/ murein hydrolase activator NlpD